MNPPPPQKKKKKKKNISIIAFPDSNLYKTVGHIHVICQFCIQYVKYPSCCYNMEFTAIHRIRNWFKTIPSTCNLRISHHNFRLLLDYYTRFLQVLQVLFRNPCILLEINFLEWINYRLIQNFISSNFLLIVNCKKLKLFNIKPFIVISLRTQPVTMRFKDDFRFGTMHYWTTCIPLTMTAWCEHNY